VLAKLGILKYSSSLESHIKHREETKPDSEQEIELRCMAIQACEEILAALNENQEKKAQWKEVSSVFQLALNSPPPPKQAKFFSTKLKIIYLLA